MDCEYLMCLCREVNVKMMDVFVGKVNSGLNVMHVTIIASLQLKFERSHQNISTSYRCINNMYGIQLFSAKFKECTCMPSCASSSKS